MFKTGSIRKIEVTNFVTYSHAELYPGPNLNMIIGPNGTGKSTMVAAIILGLGGNPKIVGRGHKISEYVKHDCENAIIHIYLQGERENKYIHVTREFDTQERNVWKLNGIQTNLTALLKHIEQYNIQVNNLCQFLPQDRVQDFAKMNKQELLKQTQIALCRTDLIEKQNLLIESRQRHKDLLSSIEDSQKKLLDSKEANVRLEGLVKNFNEKKKYNERIQHLDRRIAWALYDNIREKLQEVKADKVKAIEAYDKYKKAVEPMEKEITAGKEGVRVLQQKTSKLNQVIRNSENTIKANHDNMDTLKDSLCRIENDASAKISEIQEKEKEIELNKTKLTELKNAYSEITTRMAEDEHKKKTYTQEMQKLITTKDGLEDKKVEIMQYKQNKSAEVRSLESEITRLENVKEQRLMRLQRTDRHAYEGVLWLRENKQMFRGEIFEPIMLEVNVLDPKNAIYLENVIPARDRLAFTCVEKTDMNLLIQQLRTKKNLTISVLHSGNTGQALSQFQPNIPIEQLSKYGFYTYLHSLFTAPEPIMRYLCKTYRVHNIPIGNQKTNQCYEMVPQQIRQFFSDKYKYSISFSKYSGEKSTRQNEVSSDGGLSISVDILKLEKIKGQREDCKRKCHSYEEDLNKFNVQVEKYNEGITALKMKLRKISEQKQNADTIQNRIKALGNKIVEMEKNKTNADQILSEAKIRKKKIIQKCISLQEVIKNDFKKISSLYTQNTLSNIELDILRKQVVYLENKINDNRQALKDAENTLNKIKEHHSSVMCEAKSVLQKAKSLSNGFTPGDDGFNEFREVFDSLTGDLRMLKTEKEQLQSKISCLTTADDGEMNEYDEREKLIENLEVKIQRSNMELTKITTKMDRLREEWLNPLNQLISEINMRFSQAFERMKCAGEISLYTGISDNREEVFNVQFNEQLQKFYSEKGKKDVFKKSWMADRVKEVIENIKSDKLPFNEKIQCENPKDFSEYGILIKVTYRNNIPLQELNTTVQSGGERAVATATFMLSLQELTPVPFRCVDEINQGMDSNNERRIFELLVESTSQPNTAQYFLITPKLVPHLTFSKSMMIHIVHNGPFVVQDRKWSFSKLCNPQGAQVH